MKIPSRNRVYGAITLISAILGIPGIVFQVYAFIDEQGETEKGMQEEREKAEAEALHGKIIQARAYLENCTMTEVLRTKISLTLDRAEKELTLNDNSTGSRALYLGVITDVIQCERIMPEPPVSHGIIGNETAGSGGLATRENEPTDSDNQTNPPTDTSPASESNNPQATPDSPITESNDTSTLSPVIDNMQANLSLEPNNTQIEANRPALDIEPQLPQILRFLVIPLLALVSAGVFGFLWYRNSKTESRKRKPR